MYQADEDGNFITIFGGSTLSSSFIDSGSNTLAFPQPTGLTDCPTSEANGFYCPTTPASYSATQQGYTGTPQNAVAFQIYNTETLLNTDNAAFNNIGTTMTGAFDWGLPFFFGRVIYVGIDGASSTIGSGSYWAY